MASKQTKSSQTRKKNTTRKTPTKSSTRGAKKVNAQEAATNYKVRYELKLIVLVFFTLLSAVGLYTDVVGIVGEIFKKIYFGLFSYLAYVMPIFIFAYFFVYLNRNLKPERLRINSAISLLLFSGTLISTLFVYTGVDLSKFQARTDVLSLTSLQNSFTLGLAKESGGFFGDMITYLILKGIGLVGVYLLIIAMCVSAYIILTKVSLQDLWEKRKTEVKEKIAAKKAIDELAESLLDQAENKSESSQKRKTPLKPRGQGQSNAEGGEEHFLSEIDRIRRSNRKKHIDQYDYDAYEKNAVDQPILKTEIPSEERVIDMVNHSTSVEEKASQEEKQSQVDTAKTTSSGREKTGIQFYDAEVQEHLSKDKAPEKIKESDITPENRQMVTNEIQETTAKKFENYQLPPVTLLNESQSGKGGDDKQEYIEKAKLLEKTLNNFNVDAKVISVKKGPSITMFEVQPSPGVKVSKIVGLSDDIALNLATSQVRIAPIQGKAAIGIEIPNKTTTMVTIKEVINSNDFKKQKSKLTIGLGKDISGNPIIGDLASMPHLLIAGATGSGKSVCVNTIISSILFNATPDEVKFLMIDPKVVELSNYNGIPHLILPVVTDAKKASIALSWAVNEMTRRYKLFAETSVRDMKSYNTKVEGTDQEHLPQIVIIIDELADLMMVAPNQVEDAICRLAQMARAAGLHLIVATQRPSVDVITGLIKANIPSRIAFSVSSSVDSRTIIDMGGAEKLLGKGDMLYYPVGAPKPKRAQGAFMSDGEVEAMVDFIKNQTDEVKYNESILDDVQSATSFSNDDADEYLEEAINFVIDTGQASASMMQRRFRVGYNRAARLIESMEERGIVGPPNGSKPREVLLTRAEYEGITQEGPVSQEPISSSEDEPHEFND